MIAWDAHEYFKLPVLQATAGSLTAEALDGSEPAMRLLSAADEISIQVPGPHVPTQEQIVANITASLLEAHANVQTTARGLFFSYNLFRFASPRSQLSGFDSGEVVVRVSDHVVTLRFEASFRRLFISTMILFIAFAVFELIQAGPSMDLVIVPFLPFALLLVILPSRERQFGAFLKRVAGGPDRAA